MLTLRRKCDDEVTAVSSPERIYRDGHRIAAAWNTAHIVVNLPIAAQSLKAALQEVATPPQRTQGEDTFSGIAYLPLSEDRLVRTTLPTLSILSAKLEDTIFEQITSILFSVENAVRCLFVAAGRATESTPDKNVIS